MVHKHHPESTATAPPFENDVKMYGTQATFYLDKNIDEFENDVKMYGTQASALSTLSTPTFENDVKMYGTQAIATSFPCPV